MSQPFEALLEDSEIAPEVLQLADAITTDLPILEAQLQAVLVEKFGPDFGSFKILKPQIELGSTFNSVTVTTAIDLDFGLCQEYVWRDYVKQPVHQRNGYHNASYIATEPIKVHNRKQLAMVLHTAYRFFSDYTRFLRAKPRFHFSNHTQIPLTREYVSFTTNLIQRLSVTYTYSGLRLPETDPLGERLSQFFWYYYQMYLGTGEENETHFTRGNLAASSDDSDA